MSDFHAKEPIKAGKERISIFVETGHVHVIPHDEPLVCIDGENEGLEITITHQDDLVTVRAENRTKWRFRLGKSPQARLVVRVPETCPVKVQVVTGTIKVNDLLAPVRAKSTTGKIYLANLGDSVDASTVTGRIEYEGLLVDGDHRFSATTGKVILRLHRTPNARLDAKTVTGRIRLDYALENNKANRSFTGQRVAGTLGSGSGRIRAQVVTGSISILDKQAVVSSKPDPYLVVEF